MNHGLTPGTCETRWVHVGSFTAGAENPHRAVLSRTVVVVE